MISPISDALTDELNVFEERAENLSRDELEAWTQLTPKDERNLQKLMGMGAKLLTGPRGCGKSTLMRLAYFKLLQEGSAFPIYVNYSKSLALEPLFHTHANALLIFRQWMLCKIANGARESAAELAVSLPVKLERVAMAAARVISGLEKGELPSDQSLLVAPSDLTEWLEKLCAEGQSKRVVLLLDDSAHAFSSEQQSEFFEVFRQLKTRYIAPKAAVYPGITTYSPNFHIGHEAEQLNAWYDADDTHYISSMQKLLDRRLPEQIRSHLKGKEELVELLALVAFGIPRGFLNMVSALVERTDKEEPFRGGWAEGRPIIESHADSVRKIFASLTLRLPKFKNFVELGQDLERAMIDHLKRFNFMRPDPGRKSTRVAIEEPLGPGLERVLHMLEYSGLVRDLGSQTRGSKGTYRRYIVHHALIATENALALGRSFTLRSVCDGLAARDTHSQVRLKATSLLGVGYEARCKLNFLPCPKCGAERVMAEQRYCMRCGTELRDGSVYDELLRTSISALPMPQAKIDGIFKKTRLRSINDILADDQQQLLKVPYIGPTWAKRIRSLAQEFVSV